MGCNDINCLATCGQTFNTVDGEVVSPFVIVTFASNKDDKASQITVGNDSAPGYGNEAVIKSFDYGLSNGISIDVEILDEEGGAFSLFSDHLSRCVANASTDYIMITQFGWVIANCDGSTSQQTTPPLYSIPIQIEVNYEGGKIKYKVSGSDLMQLSFVTRENKIIGTDDKKVDLKTAIQKLFIESDPKVQVQFLSKQTGGGSTDWDFKNKPQSVWTCDNQHKLAVAQKWKENFLSTNNKGSYPIWDNATSTPTLILLEDNISQDCNQGADCSTSIGTFIVNGGNCSNVISFTPNMNSIRSMAQLGVGGNSGGATTGAVTQKRDPTTSTPCDTIQEKNVGIGQSVAYSRSAFDAYGPKDSIKQSSLAQDGQNRAGRFHTPDLLAITADMKIQGDIRFVETIKLTGLTCSVIVINPFYINNGGSGSSCGDWLAQPGCNQVLSNQNWLIIAASHSIKEGSFVTTLKLSLASPGSDLVNGLSFGGAGAGDYTPPNTCGN